MTLLSRFLQAQICSPKNTSTSSKHSKSVSPSATSTCKCRFSDSVTTPVITMGISTDSIPRSQMSLEFARMRTSPHTLLKILRINYRGPRTNLGAYTRNLHPHAGTGPPTRNPSTGTKGLRRVKRNSSSKNAKFLATTTAGVLNSTRRACTRFTITTVRQERSVVFHQLSWLLHLEDDGKPVFKIPTIKEYFVDLEYILGVISDGPTKSLAYRRLRYLASKFDMYYLLNEYQEVSDMKVRVAIP